MLHDEAIWKAVSLEKSTKRFQFSQSSVRGKHSSRCPYPLSSSRSVVRKGSSSYKTTTSSNKGKKYRGFFTHSAAGGRHFRVVQVSLAIMWNEELDGVHSLLQVSDTLFPSVLQEHLEFPFYNLGSFKTQVLQGEVDKM